MPDINMQQEKHELTLGPGEELKQARENQGLTLEDISNRLFLSKQRLIDIENDNYNNVNSFIYIKGYLRSYAKLIGLDEDDIIRKFNKLGLEEESFGQNEIIMQPKGGKIKIKKYRRRFRWLDIIAVLVVLLLAGIWWLDKKIDQEKPAAPVHHVIQQMITTS